MSLISEIRLPSFRSEFNEYTKTTDKFLAKEQIKNIFDNFNEDIQNSAHIAVNIEIVESSEMEEKIFIDHQFQSSIIENEELDKKCFGDEDYEILPKSFDYKILQGSNKIYKIYLSSFRNSFPFTFMHPPSPSLSSPFASLLSINPQSQTYIFSFPFLFWEVGFDNF